MSNAMHPVGGARTPPRPIAAVIFDLDGLLIDSEPLWRAAEVQVFTGVGVPLTEARARETTGLRTDEVVEHWFARHPWATPSKAAVAARITEAVMAHIKRDGRALPGVMPTVAQLQQQGMPLAIASSSSSDIISAVVTKLGLGDAFAVLQSAEHEPYGKPHPGVYIQTALKLGIDPELCLAVEDSANGVLAAKAAKMRCIAVPDPASRQDRRFCIADRILPSLEAFALTLLDEL